MRSHRLVALQLFAAATLWGCSCFQPVLEKQCDGKTPCGSGWLCVGGECVPPGTGGGLGGAGGGGGGYGGGVGGGYGGGYGGGVGGGYGGGVGGGYGGGYGGGAGGGAGCIGCLSINGQCVPGNTNSNCGAYGRACIGCASNQTCTNGACVNGASCNANNCSGCCNGNLCVEPLNETDLSCGLFGLACLACPPGSGCSFGKCTGPTLCNPTNCPGCCAGSQCIPVGLQNQSNCGVNGQDCAWCPAGETCTNGFCSASCGPGNCNGCCDQGKCTPFSSQTSATCGSFGSPCRSCPPGSSCTMGQCSASVCNSTTCAGCCQNGFCSPGNSQFVCGSNGNLCAYCQGNQVCSGGVCIPPPRAIGDPCLFNTDCAAIGPGAYCKTITSTGNGNYPGGFCTRGCSVDGGFGCTSNTLCLNALSPYGENDVFCSPRCSNMNQCRAPGYACYYFVSASANACWLNPIPSSGADGGQVDAGILSTIGSPCISDGQCLSPANSFCIPDVAPGVGATGFVGGYCSTSCNGAPCSSGSTCIGVAVAVGSFPVCLKVCPGPRLGQSTCRNGYVCDGATGSSSGYCLPRCSNTGANCPNGTSCNLTSGYCS